MKRGLPLFICAAVLAAAPAQAAYVPSPTTLSGGGLAVVNTVSGVISLCYKFNATVQCLSAGTVASPSANLRIISNEGAAVFYINDTASGRTMRCDMGNASTTTSGWTCILLSAALP